MLNKGKERHRNNICLECELNSYVPYTVVCIDETNMLYQDKLNIVYIDVSLQYIVCI